MSLGKPDLTGTSNIDSANSTAPFSIDEPPVITIPDEIESIVLLLVNSFFINSKSSSILG